MLISKNFKPNEIKGITIENGEKIIHLKPGVRRLYQYEVVDEDTMDHINNELINYQKNIDVYTKYFSKDDLSKNDYDE